MGWGPGNPDSLQAPGSAGPNDGAIALIGGADLPPCMQSLYAAILLFQVPGGASAGLDSPPDFYIGVRKFGTFMDFGQLIWDHSTVCGFKVVADWGGFNSATGTGVLQSSWSFYPLLLGTLPNLGRYTWKLGYYDFGGNIPVEVYFNQGIGIGAADPAQMPWRIDNFSAPRGVRMAVSSAGALVNSTGAGAAAGPASGNFTAWANGVNSLTWRQNRVYRVTMTYGIDQGSAFYTNYNIGLNSTTGALLGGIADTLIANANLTVTRIGTFLIRNSLADITGGLGVSVQKNFSGGGPVTVTLRDVSLLVEDITETAYTVPNAMAVQYA